MRVLVVEDSVQIAANIGDFLTMLGHDVDFCYNGQSALKRVLEAKFDVMILDIMMPGWDGLTTCRKVRAEMEDYLPIIFLTARDQLDDKLAGFSAGADDYLVKPFAMQELVARLDAITQRGKEALESFVTYGDLKIEVHSESVFYQEKPVKVDPVQFKLLKLLTRIAPKVVSKSDLEYALWQDVEVESSVLRTHIYRLRKALPDCVLETVRGKGYRINALP